MSRTVIVGSRLGPLTEIEGRIQAQTGAAVRLAAMPDEKTLLSVADGADVLMVGAVEPVTATVLEGLPGLRGVVRRGVGVDNVDVAAATRLGIVVAFVPDASVEEVSDHALALLLAAERRIVPAAAAVQSGDVVTARATVGASRRFADLTLGVVGFGRIGRALARKAGSVVGRVVVSDPALTDAQARELDVTLLPLAELLATADLISLHAPALTTTSSLVDTDALALLRPGAVVVNTARGELIDETALLAALDTGALAVAALDVTREEPLSPSSPLLGRSDVILTGHTAAKGMQSSSTLRTAATDAAIAVLEGRRPANLADDAVLASPRCRLGAGADGTPAHDRSTP